MKLEDVLAELEEPDALEVLQPHWEDSAATLPGGVLPFLQPAQLTVSREYCGFGPEIDAALDETARRVSQDPALTRLAWHCFRLLFEHPEYRENGQWPSLDRALGELSGVFYLLVTMGMVPRVRAVHGFMGVPDVVTRETCTQVSCIAGNFRRMTGGRLGVTRNTLGWMRHYVAGRLFRHGRMEFMIQPFRGGLEAYRSRHTGEVIALAPDGIAYNGEGYIDGAAGVFDAERGWTATLAHDEESVTGFPISPLGMAVRQEVRLRKAEWECVLKPGDAQLDMHIPAGGGMTLERCGDSMRQAAAFFRRFFPGRPFRAITCSSWIFNTQFEQIRLSSENLVRYQRELYLFPTASGPRAGLWFIFLQDDFDPATLPRDTSLRKGVADFLSEGHRWRGGGMFFLTEHLEQFGTQRYRSRWPPAGIMVDG